MLLCFEQPYDREVVLNRAHTLDRTGLMITEDMTRYQPIRDQYSVATNNINQSQASERAVGRVEEVHGQGEEQVSNLAMLLEENNIVC